MPSGQFTMNVIFRQTGHYCSGKRALPISMGCGGVSIFNFIYNQTRFSSPQSSMSGNTKTRGAPPSGRGLLKI